MGSANIWASTRAAEFQYTAQFNEIGSASVNNLEMPADGTVYSNLFMVNVLYDIPIADRWAIYVGGGVGGLYGTWSGNYSIPTSSGPTNIEVNDNNGWGFAYQVMVGVAYERRRTSPSLRDTAAGHPRPFAPALRAWTSRGPM